MVLSKDEVARRIQSLRDRNIELVSEYTKGDDKHSFRCLKSGCGYEWTTTFYSVYKAKTGCARCDGQVFTELDIQKRLSEINQRNINLIGDFIGSSKKHTFECMKPECKHSWITTFTSVDTLKTGCPKCAGKILSSSDIEVMIKELIDRNILLTSEFTRVSKKYTFKCLNSECGLLWDTSFQHIYYRKQGCPQCAGKFVSDEVIKERIQSIQDRGIELLSSFVGTNKNHSFRCKVESCNHVWNTSFNSVYNGSGCTVCTGKSLSENEAKRRVNELKSRGVKLITPYTTMHARVKFQCLKSTCNHIWSTSVESVYLHKTGCPRCAGQALTEEEKLISQAQLMINKRLSNLFRRGKTNFKLHRDNEFMAELMPHWIEQYKLIPTKPTHGNWHLDHIVPVSWFNPHDIEQQKLCWHHQNLRWLTASENASRRNNMRQKDILILTDWHHSAISKASYAKCF